MSRRFMNERRASSILYAWSFHAEVIKNSSKASTDNSIRFYEFILFITLRRLELWEKIQATWSWVWSLALAIDFFRILSPKIFKGEQITQLNRTLTLKAFTDFNLLLFSLKFTCRLKISTICLSIESANPAGEIFRRSHAGENSRSINWLAILNAI